MLSTLRRIVSPEAQLLFLAGAGEGFDERIRELVVGGIDWPEVIQLAEREQAVVALSRCLQRCGSGVVPQPVADRLRTIARVVQFNMLWLAQRLDETLDALAHAGVECVPLKGAAVASTVYPSFADRPMVDLDVLIRGEQSEAAIAAALGAGWVWDPRKPRAESFDHLHHIPGMADSTGLWLSLELHTRLVPPSGPFTLEPERVLAGAMPVTIGTRTRRVPKPVHLLIHACMHFAWSHLMRQGAWRTFRDARAISTTHAIDWDDFVTEARATRARTCCYWTLRLARALMGVAVPDEVLAALRPPLPDATLSVLERHFAIVLLPSGPLCPSVSLRRLMWSLGIRPRWSGHGDARPWISMALRPEDIESRAHNPAAIRASEARRSGRAWFSYCQRVLRAPA